MEFRPCIDLHDGKVKQIVGGTLSDDNPGALRTNFESALDSADYARMYRKDHLTGGHVIMLGPGNEAAARRALEAWPGGLQVGGGIHAGNLCSWLEAGAAQVILTSAVFHDGELDMVQLETVFRLAGRERLVLDLSCRIRDGKYFVVTDRWTKFTRLEVGRETLEKLAPYCCEFLIHAVDVEGKQQGIDEDLLQLMAENSPLPCVYAGGIRSLEDIERIRQAGNGKIHFTVGSALDIFGGSLKYDTVRAVAGK